MGRMKWSNCGGAGYGHENLCGINEPTPVRPTSYEERARLEWAARRGTAPTWAEVTTVAHEIRQREWQQIAVRAVTPDGKYELSWNHSLFQDKRGTAFIHDCERNDSIGTVHLLRIADLSWVRWDVEIALRHVAPIEVHPFSSFAADEYQRWHRVVADRKRWDRHFL